MSIKTDNYIRFFKDQVEEIKKEYNKTKAIPMRQLFREDVLTLAYVDGINLANGHITIKVRKGFAPRLKVMKNFTIVSKKARETLGAPHNWNLSFEDFNNIADYHVGLSDLFPIHFLHRADPDYDYIGCSSVSMQMFSRLERNLSMGKTITILLFDPFPPTEYFNNLANYTYVNSSDQYLNIEPKIA